MISVNAQPCLPGGIIFSTQEEIDNFQINYPGCREIEGNVTISGSGISNLNGLIILESIGGYLVIQNNNLLTNLAGLDSLISIGMFISIRNNYSLNSLSGLGSLSSVKETLSIAFNNSLTDLSGLDAIMAIDDLLYIESNDHLTSLSGLNALTYIGDLMEIRNNDALTSLNGLESLTAIGGDLWIYDNNELASLSGLIALSSIRGEVYIGANFNLTSLAGIENIDHHTISGIHIQYNELLSFCNVQSICDFLSNPTGPIDIENNSTGCSTQEEVETACEAIGVENISIDYDFTIFPNPSSGLFTINLNLEEQPPVNLIVRNNLGQIIVTLIDETLTTGLHQINWNAEDLPAGIYFYQMSTSKKTRTGKIMITK
jgi:hypothetical protein